MKSMKMTGWLVAAALLASTPVWAEPTAAQADRIKQAQQDIDGIASKSTDDRHVQALKGKLNVNDEAVTRLREKNQSKGWGEIAAQAAMAKELTRFNPGAYADTNTALGAIEERRAQGKNWDEIARDIDAAQFDLSKVADDVNAVRDEFRKAGEEGASQASANVDGAAQELRQTQQDIDRTASTLASDEERQQAIATAVGAPAEDVKEVREENKSEGWGEVTVQLALAKEMHQSKSAEYASMQAAMDKVEELRNQGKRLEEIAREQSIELRPVLDMANRVRDAFKTRAA